MHETPKLRCTKDYSLFDTHEHNRRLHGDQALFESMKRHGFMPSSPIQCVRETNGKLRVIRGHNRLDCAKRLGLHVWYVVDDSNTDLYSLEAGRQKWSIEDFARSRAKAGDAACLFLLDFMDTHKLKIGAAASLVGGESASSSNKANDVKRGTFRVADDLSHAYAVVSVTDRCLSLGVRWATSTAFVAAVSRALRVPEFDPNLFLHRLAQRPAALQRSSTAVGNIQQIEKVYNYGAKDRRLALEFRANEEMRKRSAADNGLVVYRPDEATVN